MARYCSYCGMRISEKARFCRYCGKKVDEDIEPVMGSNEHVPVYPVNEPVESEAIHIEPVNAEPAEPEQIQPEPVMPEQIHIIPAEPEPEKVSSVTDDTVVLDPFYEMSDSAPDEPTVIEPVQEDIAFSEPVPAEPEPAEFEPIHIDPAEPEPAEYVPFTDDTVVLDPFYAMSDSAPDEPTVIEPVQEDPAVPEPVPAEPEPVQPESVQEEPAGPDTIEDLPIIEVPAEPEPDADLPPIVDTLVLDPYYGDLVKPKHVSAVTAEPRPVYSDSENPEPEKSEPIITEPAEAEPVQEEPAAPEPVQEKPIVPEPVRENITAPEPAAFVPVTDNTQVLDPYPDPYFDRYDHADVDATVKEPTIHEPVIPAPDPVSTGAVTYGLIDDYPVRRNTARMDPVVPDPGMGGGPSGPYYPYSDYGYDDEEDDDDGGGMSKRMIAFIAALAGIVATCLIIGIILWACNGDSESEPAPEPEPAPAEQQETPEPEPEPAPAPAAYPEGALEFNGHHYVIYNESASWSSAVELCKSKNGHLVTITSAEEQAFIRQKLEEDGLKRHHYWLGATDAENEGSWRWITGEPFSYNNWDPGDGADHDRQPNNTLDQDYMELQTTRATANNYMTWNDMCDSGDNGANQNEPWYYMQQYFGYICEWDE